MPNGKWLVKKNWNQKIVIRVRKIICHRLTNKLL